MNIRDRRIYIIVSVLLVLIVLMLSLLLKSKTSDNFTETKEIKEETVYQVNTAILEEQKMYDFIISHLHEPIMFNSLTINTGDINPKEAPFQILYTSLLENDVDLFLSAFSYEATSSLWDSKKSIEEREAHILEAIASLSKNGTLEHLNFQFLMDSYGLESNDGVLIWEFKSGEIIKTPFQLQKVESEEGEGNFYQIYTPIIEFINAVTK